MGQVSRRIPRYTPGRHATTTHYGVFQRRGAVFARHVTVIIYSVARYFHPYATNLDPICLPLLPSCSPLRLLLRLHLLRELCEIADTRLGTRGASYDPVPHRRLNHQDCFDPSRTSYNSDFLFIFIFDITLHIQICVNPTSICSFFFNFLRRIESLWLTRMLWISFNIYIWYNFLFCLIF